MRSEESEEKEDDDDENRGGGETRNEVGDQDGALDDLLTLGRIWP